MAPSIERQLLASALLLITITSTFQASTAQDETPAAATSFAHIVPQVGEKSYIVSLKNLPAVAAYDGGYRGYHRTSINFETGETKLQTDAPHVQQYAAHLRTTQRTVLLSHSIPATKIIHSYQFALNGFSALLTDQQVQALENDPRVYRVEEDRRESLNTVYTPKFLNLTLSVWKADGGVSSAGENIIIGDIDTGVWPENYAFSDKTPKAFGPVPAKWKGTCNYGGKVAFTCNKKLIGGGIFYKGFLSQAKISNDYLNMRDNGDHGSHTASTSSGNNNNKINYLYNNDETYYLASGMAPRARLAMYKVFWNSPDKTWSGEAMSSDIVDAINKAVKDGVDVLTVSISSDLDPTGARNQAYLGAARANIFVCNSAGNSGPNASTVESSSPWIVTVGAGTHNRDNPNAEAPRVDDYSSRGPLYNLTTIFPLGYSPGDLLGPDILAPGSDIWAAVRPGKGQKWTTQAFGEMSGTSMATPHVAGIGALIRQKYPKWSTFAIKSAILTTANKYNNKKKLINEDDDKEGINVATPLSMGAGHINPTRVLDPGLVYDEAFVNINSYLQRLDDSFGYPKSIPTYNVNMPYIIVSGLETRVTVTRTVTNMTPKQSAYVAKVTSPDYVTVTVKPNKFAIAPWSKVTFTVTIVAYDSPGDNSWSFGELVWSDTVHSVRSVIGVQVLN